MSEWLREGGSVDELRPSKTSDSRRASFALLHSAAGSGRLEMVKMLLNRGASVDLPTSLGYTALMHAAHYGHLSTVMVLLKHSANPDLQDLGGQTALMEAAVMGQEACVQVLLRAKANTELLDNQGRTALQWAEIKGHAAVVEIIRQRGALPPPATAMVVNSPAASLPREIFNSAEKGELQMVVGWLDQGGPVDALCSSPTEDARPSEFGLLHAATGSGRLEMAMEVLERGASVDLPSSLGATPLMGAAHYGYLSVLLVLLQHSADPDYQDIDGDSALMRAADQGQEACVKALLRAKANTELLDNQGRTAQQWAEIKGHTAIAKLIQQHACRSLVFGVALCAALPFAWPWMTLSVVLGSIAAVAFSRTLTARPGQHRAARQRRPHRPARSAKAKGHTNATALMRQQPAAPPQPIAAAAPQAALHAAQVQQAARLGVATEELLAESAVERAEAALRAATARRLQKEAERDARREAATYAASLVAAERVVQLEVAAREAAEAETVASKAREEAEEAAEAAAEAARLAASKRGGEMATSEARRVEAASKARKEAVEAVAAATVALAKADALERATADGGEGGGSGAAGPLSEAKVPDDYMCPITAEIMTDPVSTLDGFTYEREAITEWLRTKDTSPTTGATLESKKVIPNYSLRSIIRSFTEACATAVSPPPQPAQSCSCTVGREM